MINCVEQVVALATIGIFDPPLETYGARSSISVEGHDGKFLVGKLWAKLVLLVISMDYH